MRSISARFSTWAFAAIVVPAVIVAGLGLISLRQWERSAELLFREQARDVATMAAEKIEMVLRRAEDEALARIQAILARGELSAPELDRFLAETPLATQLYLFDRQGQLLYPERPREGDAAVFAGLVAEVSQGLWERGSRRDFVAGDAMMLAAILHGPRGAPVLVTLARSLDGLRREVFEKALTGLEPSTPVAIIDERGTPVYTREALDQARLLVAVPFRGAFPHWRVALYQPSGVSPRQTVRRQVAIFMAAFGVLVAVIVAGLVVTYRLVRRETEMARLKSDFVANVSHDLKTPLSVIRMYGETLELDRVRDEATRREYYRVITRESERLSRLIDNVLDFSRIEGGRRTYERVPTAVEPLVRETLEAFAYPLAQQGFKTDVTVAPDVPDVALDAEAVGQALANLVDNAIKYSGERKSVSVDARVVERELAITVADEGVGIPRDEQGRIFEKFYRVGRSETQSRRGSGVGLTLVAHVAQAHGGRVTVESQPGEGSRFTLWISLNASHRSG